MKWIDEKGRLWGRINLIDLTLILILIAALAFAGMKFLGKGEIQIIAEKQTVTFTLFTNSVFPFVKDQMQEGDEVRLVGNNAVLGTIESLEIKTGYGLIATADGRWIEADIPNKYSIDIVIKGEATKSGEAFTIGGTPLLAGNEITIKGPKYTVKGLISYVK